MTELGVIETDRKIAATMTRMWRLGRLRHERKLCPVCKGEGYGFKAAIYNDQCDWAIKRCGICGGGGTIKARILDRCEVSESCFEVVGGAVKLGCDGCKWRPQDA